MNDQTVTVQDALLRQMADDDNPVLLYGDCPAGIGAHIVLELFLGGGQIIRRCCICGREDHPVEADVMAVQAY